MIMRMRLYPKDSAEPIWEYVINTLGSMSREKVKPLFASIQTGARFVSVFLLVDDMEEVGDLLVKEIGDCEEIADTMTIPLLKMAFLPVVERDISKMKRYSVMIKTRPRHYYTLYKKIIDLQPGIDVVPNFASFTLGNYDILLSVWSPSKRKVEGFVDERIRGMEEVVKATIFPVAKTRIFMPLDDWRRFQRAFLYIPSWVTKDMRNKLAFAFFPSDEDIGLSGGMTEES